MLKAIRRFLGRTAPLPAAPRWVLVPLGNPGAEYEDTRHNLGRQMVQQWMAARGVEPREVRRFATGTLYDLGGLLALVPATYMNLSGQVCAEAVQAGLDPARLVVVFDDKDLPLGTARFRPEGSAGGHNGLASVIERLGTPKIARLRLGIGPFTRPLHEFVLQSWTEDERPKLAALEAPFAAFLERLAGSSDLAVLTGDFSATNP